MSQSLCEGSSEGSRELLVSLKEVPKGLDLLRFELGCGIYILTVSHVRDLCNLTRTHFNNTTARVRRVMPSVTYYEYIVDALNGAKRYLTTERLVYKPGVSCLGAMRFITLSKVLKFEFRCPSVS